MRRNFSQLALAAISLVCFLVLTACNTGGKPKLQFITVTPSSATITAGTTQQFMATGHFSDGTTTPNLSVVWGSSAATVAKIDPVSGVATALSGGTSNITATASGITSTPPAVLTVLGLTAINLTPANKTINFPGTQQYTATGTYSDASTADITSQIDTWGSSRTAVATISNTGLATAAGPGNTIISASISTVPGVNGNTTLTVSGVPVPLSLVVTPATPTIAVGNSEAFTAMEMWSDGSTHNPSGAVTWSSDTAATATVVPSAGLAVAHAAGTATIKATEGSLTPGTTLLTVVAGTSHYAYVSNVSDLNIQWYAVNAGTSPYLTSQGTVAVGSGSFQTLLHPNGIYMYVIDESNSSAVHVFTIAPATSVTPAPGTPVETTQTPISAGTGDSTYGVVDPYGRFLYVTDDLAGTITGFTLSPTDGSLTAIAGSPFTTNLSTPVQPLIDPSGSYLYVVNAGNNTVSAYMIDQSTGALAPNTTKATIATGAGPQFATMDPSGTHLYVANDTAGTVSAYSINAADGTLSELASSPTTITGAAAVFNVAVDPSGSHIYVLDTGDTVTPGHLYGFTLTSGAIGSAVAGSPQATGLGPTGITIDATGKLLAIDNGFDTPGTISLIPVGANGAISAGTKVNAGGAPIYVTFYNAP